LARLKFAHCILLSLNCGYAAFSFVAVLLEFGFIRVSASLCFDAVGLDEVAGASRISTKPEEHAMRW